MADPLSTTSAMFWAFPSSTSELSRVKSIFLDWSTAPLRSLLEEADVEVQAQAHLLGLARSGSQWSSTRRGSPTLS